MGREDSFKFPARALDAAPLALRRRLAQSSPCPDIGALGFQAAFCTVERDLPHAIPVDRKRSVEPCGALIFEDRVIGTAHYRVSEQEKRFRAEFDPLSLLAAGQSLEEVAAALRKNFKPDWQPRRTKPTLCSLPSDHKGPHASLNPRA